MCHAGPTLPESKARLASWKAIADYLGRSPRTVQRWLIDYGLPIHRMGGASGPIFAYADELDLWLRNRGHAKRIAPSAKSTPSPNKPVPIDGPLDPASAFDFPALTGLHTSRSAEFTAAAHRMWETSSSTDFSAAVRIYRDAINLDPSNARALAGLSFVLLVGGLLANINHPLYSATAEDALHRAIEIDPDAVPVRNARGWTRMAVHHDWKAARRHFTDALARNPLYNPALVGRALLHIAENNLPEASDLLLEASSQCPLSAPTTLLRCWSAYLAGNSSAALDLLTQARLVGHTGSLMDALEALTSVDRDDPEGSLNRLKPLTGQPAPHPLLLGVLGYCYAASGQVHEAQSILRSFMQTRSHGRQDVSYPLALIFMGLHDRSNAVRWLKQSYADGSLWSLGFPSDPMLASLRLDPLYQTYLNDFNYPVSEDSAARLASAS